MGPYSLVSLSESHTPNLTSSPVLFYAGIFLKKIMQIPIFDPVFSPLLSGCRLEPGMLIIFNKCLVFEILVNSVLLSIWFPFGFILCNLINDKQLKDVRRYVSFSDMLESENLQSILPGVESLDEGNLLCIYTTFS